MNRVLLSTEAMLDTHGLLSGGILSNGQVSHKNSDVRSKSSGNMFEKRLYDRAGIMCIEPVLGGVGRIDRYVYRPTTSVPDSNTSSTRDKILVPVSAPHNFNAWILIGADRR